MKYANETLFLTFALVLSPIVERSVWSVDVAVPGWSGDISGQGLKVSYR